MKITKRDLFFIAAIVALLVVLFVGKDKSKSVSVPNDDKHIHYYEAVTKGQDRVEVEKQCGTCHGSLSKDHPPKGQCLVCHKLSQTKK